MAWALLEGLRWREQGQEGFPGLWLRTILASASTGMRQRGGSVNVDQPPGMLGPRNSCAALSVRVNYSIKCEASPTYQIIDKLNYSSLSNHTGHLQK